MRFLNSREPAVVTSSVGSVMPAGNYSCFVTDANNCNTVFTQTLINPNGPTVIVSYTNVGCEGETKRSITLTVTGGDPAYTSSWSSTLQDLQISAPRLVPGFIQSL
jgi:hypothetical protein